MSIFIHHEKPLNVKTSGGSWNSSSIKFRGLCHQIIVKANTSSTTFDFTVIDDDNLEVFHRDSNDGELNELLLLPLQGYYTLRISNSTKDESYTIKLILREI